MQRVDLRSHETRVRGSIGRAIATVRRTIATCALLASIPGYEASAHERLIAAEEELALLQAQAAILDRGELWTPQSRWLLHEAVRSIGELAKEDRRRHGAGQDPG